MKSTLVFFALLLFIQNSQLNAKNYFDFSTSLPALNPGDVVKTGDMNGDGKLDIVVYAPTDGSLKVGINNGQFSYTNGSSNLGFTFSKWSPDLSPIAGWTLIIGDYSGDGLNDIVLYHPSYQGNNTIGSIWVGVNNGNSWFNYQLWGLVNRPHNWQFVQGDFNMDGKQDLVGYQPNYNGSATHAGVWGFINTGTAFNITPWYTSLAPATGWQIFPGDFTNDGKPDIACFYPGNATMWVIGNNASVGASTGTFVNTGNYWWSDVPSSNGWEFYTGDFTGDNVPDFAGYNKDNGTVNMLKNNVSLNNFQSSVWRTVAPANGYKFSTGDFSGDNKLDMVGYFPSNASMWMLFNTNNSLFDVNQWDYNQNLSSSAGWALQTGDFNNDNRPDALGFDESSGAFKLGINAPHLEGYCWPMSARPNDTINFYISGNGVRNIVVEQYFSVDDHVTSVVKAVIPNINHKAQYIPGDAWKNGCNWSNPYKLAIPVNWQSGFYAVKLTDTRGETDYIPFIVKAAQPSATKIALLANVNTWQAYNGWAGVVNDNTDPYQPGAGGRSKYEPYPGYATFSFLRPNPIANPVINPDTNSNVHMNAHHSIKGLQHTKLRGELWIYTWLLNNGYAPDVYTDIDLHNEPLDTAYQYFIIGTHPEYWTTAMYDHTKDFMRDGGGYHGGNVISIGGNSIYEACNYNLSSTNKQIQFYNGLDFADRNNYLFRRDAAVNPLLGGVNRPETGLTGTETVAACNEPGQYYSINQAYQNQPFYQTIFAGINNPTFGHFSYCNGDNHPSNYGQAAGWEVDGSGAPNPGSSTPVSYCGTYPGSGTSIISNIKILASASNGSQLIYIPSSGAPYPNNHGYIFSGGSITFGGSLVYDTDIQTMMHNLLNYPGNVVLKPGMDDTTGQSQNGIRVYPNPTKGLITIEGEKSFNEARISLQATDGKVILDMVASGQAINLDIATASPGLYFLKITDKNKVQLAVMKLSKK